MYLGNSSRASALAVAIHEAGHAAALLLSSPPVHVGGMWLERRRGSWEGQVEYVHRWQSSRLNIPWTYPADAKLHADRMRRNALDDLVTHLAGPVAEWRWRDKTRIAAQVQGRQLAKVCRLVDHEPASDFGLAKRNLLWLGGDFDEGFIASWDAAEALLAPRWSAVVGLGRLLKAKGRLDADEIRAAWDGLQ